MESEENGLQPVFSHAEPVLAVQDVAETIRYWQDVLGFPVKWSWGEPPGHGAVSWHKAFIQFHLDPALAAASKGNSVWIRVQHPERIYHIHQKRKADIVAPLENQPWGMAQYTVKEINGYYLHFAGPMAEGKKSTEALPSTVSIIARLPTVQESRALASAVGWSPPVDDDMIKTMLSSVVFAVVAVDSLSGETIGSALLMGDRVSYYYVKDVMVRPDWQGKRVGTAMMQELNRWLDSHGANNALVGLFTGETLEPFYQQAGFGQAFGMLRYIRRDEKDK